MRTAVVVAIIVVLHLPMLMMEARLQVMSPLRRHLLVPHRMCNRFRTCFGKWFMQSNLTFHYGMMNI